MSTSIRDLNAIQLFFQRTSYFLGFVFILAMIILKPTYNTLPVLLAIPIFMAMYQARYYIYKLGIGRFDLLALLIYLPFILTFFVNWEYKSNVVSPALDQINVFDLHSILAYMDNIYSLCWQSLLDAKAHWKTIMFAPAFASILYFLFVEGDRKKVKKTDLHNLELTESDLFKRGSVCDGLAAGLFLLSSFIYGVQVGVMALLILALFLFAPNKIYICLAGLLSVCILVLGFKSLNYLVFMAFPTIVSGTLQSDGLWHGLKEVTQFSLKHNIGQLYIIVPYLLCTGIITLINIRHRSKVEEINFTENKLQEIRTTEDAFIFGREVNTGKPVRLTHSELNKHMYINGASGSGKTVAMLNFVIEAAEKGLPLIYIDGKGSTDLEEKMSTIAAQYNRVFKVFTLSPKLVANASGYDFLGSGGFTEKKNRVMNLFITAEAAGASYYQDNLEEFINSVFMLIEYKNLNIDLFRFLDLISNINDLIGIASEDIITPSGHKISLRSYFESIRDMKPEQSPRTRIITKLSPFIHSTYGHLFNVIDKDNVIRIKDSIKNGEIVLFLFEASTFALDTERVAKMVISDINATFGELGAEKTPIKTFCCFDEFKSYETDAIAKTISLHRSNGMHAIIGTQSLALIDKEIANSILSNCQTHFVMVSSSDDAERFANEFGERNKIEYSTRIQTSGEEVQDITARQIKDFVVDKQSIKDIQVETGKGFLHRKAVGFKPVKIQVSKKI